MNPPIDLLPSMPPALGRVLKLRPPRVAMALVLLAAAGYAMGLDAKARLIGFGPWALIPGIAGLGVMLWAWFEFRRRRNPICHTADPIALVASGPFRFSRNPMYVGIFAALVAPFLWTGAWIYLAPPFGFAAFIGLLVVPFEERRLVAALGDAYKVYKDQTRRWF